MKPWSRRIPFKVDIAGVIRILGSALYSRPDAALRELMQNAHDAVMRRRQKELGYQGRIDIRLSADEPMIEFRDDGIGLSADEAEQYLGTLGIGLTGIMKGEHPSAKDAKPEGGSDELIGMFGIGLFSAFMLADQMVVESRRHDSPEGIRWVAGGGTDIELSSFEREEPGTTIRLFLKPEFSMLAESEELFERIIKEYADFLTVPIFLNQAKSRANVIHVSWFDPTPELETIELDLASYFDETPLDVIPIQISNPVEIAGALYVTPQRVPGFAGDTVVTVTIRRMVISRHIQGLLPEWASFLRGVLELRGCWPTASREDLVRNHEFEVTRLALESYLFEHFERLAQENLAQMEAILTWHRYHWAGAAIAHPRIRNLLRGTYKFPTSQGQLTYEEILERSGSDPIFETEFDHVIWYNTDRRQEVWVNSLFADQSAPCVHTLRSFEESLLAAFTADSGPGCDLRFAVPSSEGFASGVLQIDEVEQAPGDWAEFLGELDATISIASFRDDQPVMAFLNERHELKRTFDDLKKSGTVPQGFQRLIDSHFDDYDNVKNEILLNREHRLVARALEQKTSSPLAGVLRMLVAGALRSAGAALPSSAQRQQAEDLDWIAECLWGKNE